MGRTPADLPMSVATGVGGPHDYLAYLYKRKNAITRLVQALDHYLSEQIGFQHNNDDRIEVINKSVLVEALGEYLFDNIDQQIAQMEAPPPDYSPHYTIENLMEAQKVVETAQAGLDALAHMCRDLEENGQEATAEFMRKSQMMQLEAILEPAKARVGEIQAYLEKPAADPSNPWPGTHRIGTLCAECAKPYHGVESSVKKLNEALAAAGWKRDADGDHICPECVKKAEAK